MQTLKWQVQNSNLNFKNKIIRNPKATKHNMQRNKQVWNGRQESDDLETGTADDISRQLQLREHQKNKQNAKT